MIVLDRSHLKFLKAGRIIRVTVPRQYRKGRVYTASSDTKKGRYRVQIIDIARADGGWELLIRQSTEEVVYYLSANPAGSRADYTTNPARAARDPDGVCIQAADAQEDGERIEAGRWLQKIADEASQRDDARRRELAHASRMARRNTTTMRYR